VDAQLIEDVRRLVAYAPLHLPAASQGIEAVAARFPHLPQGACVDTAFHRRVPERAQRFPLPRSFWDEGIRRYGFHGLSSADSIAHLGAMSLGRASIAHLGKSASMAAVYNRQPWETTMGFTPTGGVMMGTRTGDLAPGLLLHLLTEKGYDAPQLTQLGQQQSGLLGVSGLSPDMQLLLAQRAHDRHAAQAVDLYTAIASGALSTRPEGCTLIPRRCCWSPTARRWPCRGTTVVRPRASQATRLPPP
jgi:acetate kinase